MSIMTWLWIPITIFASACQTVRTALQKALAGKVSTNAAAFVRFAYGAPFALIYVLILSNTLEIDLPHPNGSFLIWILIGSIAQIVATSLLIQVLGLRNFPVGVAYSKTEVIQVAIFGLVFLGDQLTFFGLAAILLSTLGVMLVSISRGSLAPKALLRSWLEKPALLGIASGACFGLSAIGVRGASLSVGLESPFFTAAYALAWMTAVQTILMALYLYWREREQFKRLANVWKPSLFAGLASVFGSAGWFTAMTLQTVAYVRTLALIELVFTFGVSALWFRERAHPREVIGITLLSLGIVMVLNLH